MTPEEPPYDPEACPACRGTGTVVSTEGGKPSDVQCPWCEGSGKRPPLTHDAQARWRSA